MNNMHSQRDVQKDDKKRDLFGARCRTQPTAAHEACSFILGSQRQEHEAELSANPRWELQRKFSLISERQVWVYPK